MTLTTSLPLATLLALGMAGGAEEAPDGVRVGSPDGRIELRLFVAERTTGRDTPPRPQLAYQVTYGGQLLVDTSFLGLEMQGRRTLGENVTLVSSETGVTDERYTLPVGKSREARDHHH